MAASESAQPTDQKAGHGKDRWLATLGATIWDNLPLLLAIDLLFCVAALPALMIAIAGAGFVAPVAAALTLGPLWLGTMEAGRRLLAGEVVTVRRYLGLSRQRARLGVSLAMVPAVALTLLLGTLRIVGSHPDQRWLIMPLAVNGCLTMLALCASFWVFPLATLTQARGRSLWRLAFIAAGSAPLATLGTVALLVFLWLGWRYIGPLAPVVLAAPFALYLAGLSGWWFRWAEGKVSETGDE